MARVQPIKYIISMKHNNMKHNNMKHNNMKHNKFIITVIAIVTLIPAITFAQSSSLWKLIGGILSPVVSSWPVKVPGDFTIGGSAYLTPLTSTVLAVDANHKIIATTTTAGTSLSGGTTDWLTYWTSDTTVGATSSPVVGYITATSTTATSTFSGLLSIGTTTVSGTNSIIFGDPIHNIYSSGSRLKINGGSYLDLLADTISLTGAVMFPAIQSDLIPDGDNVYRLGATTSRWKSLDVVSATTTSLAITGLSDTFLAVDSNGSVIATTTPGGASLSGGITNALTYWTSDTTVGATSSPVVGYITATSTATSTFAGNIDIAGDLLVQGGIVGEMTLSSAGNTSIGGTLNVTGNTTLNTSLNGLLQAVNGLVSASSSPSLDAMVGVLSIGKGGTNSSSQANNGINFYNGTSITSSTTFVALANGNVGIGITSPNYTLEVNGTASTTRLSIPSTSSTSVGVISQDGVTLISTYTPFGKTGNLFIGAGGVSAGNDTYSNMTDGGNVGFGRALKSLTGGSSNTAIGYNAMYYTTSGGSNVAIGSSALINNTTGSNNMAIGATALTNNKKGSFNVAVGDSALSNVQGSASSYGLNVGIGRGAGNNLTGDSSKNTFIGYAAGWTDYYACSGSAYQTASVSNSTAIGVGAVTTASNVMVLGAIAPSCAVNVGIGTTSPYARFSIQANPGDTANTLFVIASSTSNATSTHFAVLANGNVGIGTTSPLSKLSVDGDVTITGNTTITNASTTDVTVSGTLYATVKQYSSFTYATTTAWSGTTTIPLGTAYVAETWNGAQCYTDAGFLNVQFSDGTNVMNTVLASTTVQQTALSSNNTFTATEKRFVNIGTPASSPTKVSCTVSKSVATQ
jgi:hypothetical protein